MESHSPPLKHLSLEQLSLLRQAIALAAQARASSRHPFGVLIADEYGKVIIAAVNNSMAGDPTQHACPYL